VPAKKLSKKQEKREVLPTGEEALYNPRSGQLGRSKVSGGKLAEKKGETVIPT